MRRLNLNFKRATCQSWQFSHSYHKPPGNPSLTVGEINRTLRKDQISFQFKSNALLNRIDISSMPSNNPSEDRIFYAPMSDDLLLGVVDGHWSGDTSEYVSKALPEYFLKSQGSDLATKLIDTFERLDKDITSTPWRVLPELNGSLQSIKDLPESTKVRALAASQIAFSGCCALAVHISGSKVHIANTGDCRAIVGSKDAVTKRCRATALSSDQQPSNPSELHRLYNDHPGEEATVAYSRKDGVMRLLGGLMPSRCFGDSRYKYSLTDQEKIDALLVRGKVESYAYMRPNDLYTPPYLTATPEITYHDILDNDRFLVISTDGLFDSFSNQEIVNHLEDFIASNQEDQNAATYLIRMACSGRDQEYLSRMISLDSTQSRGYRDDMTVQVIFLNADTQRQLKHSVRDIKI